MHKKMKPITSFHSACTGLIMAGTMCRTKCALTRPALRCHTPHRNKWLDEEFTPCSRATRLPIDSMDALVQPGSYHYNRREWMRVHWWNAGCVRRIHQYRENSVEEPLKRLMQELGNAINDSLSESDRIAEAIGEIKKAGYDVFLVLEATIGFNRREGDEEDAEDLEVTEEQQPPPPKKTFESAAKIKLTTQDHPFLRALKIAVDDDR